MSNRFVVILLALVVAFAGVFLVTKKKNTSNSGGTNSAAKLSNHIEGQGKKGVTLTEYGDFQCPACGQYYPLVKQIKAKYASDIVFQFRNFPLTQIHPNARAAARAAEAAGKQNKFWEMHNILYEQQQSWSTASDPNSFFQQYAKQLSLDTVKFKQDAASSAINDIINADVAEAERLGANSTPTFVLDGKKIDKNPQDLDGFNKLIDAAIKAKQ